MSVTAKTSQAAVYNDKVVRQFAIMTVVWGVVGMLVGVLIAAQLNAQIPDQGDFVFPHNTGKGADKSCRIGEGGQGRKIIRFNGFQMTKRNAGLICDIRQIEPCRQARGAKPIANTVKCQHGGVCQCVRHGAFRIPSMSHWDDYFVMR